MTKAGRKRNFDKTEALDKAIHVFWENGYAGTSLSDLTEALDINKPSLYAAFGNKETLFNAALKRYVEHFGTSTRYLKEPESLPLIKRLEQYLCAVSKNVTSTSTPKGCFFVKSCYENGSEKLPDASADFLASSSKQFEQQLQDFFTQEQQKGTLSSSQDAKSIAQYFAALLYGFSVMARNGMSESALTAVAKTALANFPVTKPESS